MNTIFSILTDLNRLQIIVHKANPVASVKVKVRPQGCYSLHKIKNEAIECRWVLRKVFNIHTDAVTMPCIFAQIQPTSAKTAPTLVYTAVCDRQ